MKSTFANAILAGLLTGCTSQIESRTDPVSTESGPTGSTSSNNAEQSPPSNNENSASATSDDPIFDQFVYIHAVSNADLGVAGIRLFADSSGTWDDHNVRPVGTVPNIWTGGWEYGSAFIYPTFSGDTIYVTGAGTTTFLDAFEGVAFQDAIIFVSISTDNVDPASGAEFTDCTLVGTYEDSYYECYIP